MRKHILFFSIMLLVVSIGAFAQTDWEWDFDAEVSASFGFNLDKGDSGISNEEDFRIQLTLREKSTEEFGEGRMYGWIKVKDIEIKFDSDANIRTDKETSHNHGQADNTAEKTKLSSGKPESATGKGEGGITLTWGDIEGRVYITPNVYLELDAAEDKVDLASNVSIINHSVVQRSSTLKNATSQGGTSLSGFDLAVDPSTKNAGVALGVSLPDKLDVELGMASVDTWDAKTENKNAYVISADVNVKAISNLEIDLTSSASIGRKGALHGSKDAEKIAKGLSKDTTAGLGGTDNPAALGLKVKYTLDLTDDIKLSPIVGVDYAAKADNHAESRTRMEFGGGVQLTWKGLGLNENDGGHIGFMPGDEEVSSGLSLGGTYGTSDVGYFSPSIAKETGKEKVNVLGMNVSLFEDSGDKGLLPMLGGALVFDYNSVAANKKAGLEKAYTDMGFGIEVNAKVGILKPTFGFLTEMINTGGVDLNTDGDKKNDQHQTMFIKIAADIVDVIPNTTFTLEWLSGDLSYDKKDHGDVKAQDAPYDTKYVYGEALSLIHI